MVFDSFSSCLFILFIYQIFAIHLLLTTIHFFSYQYGRHTLVALVDNNRCLKQEVKDLLMNLYILIVDKKKKI